MSDASAVSSSGGGKIHRDFWRIHLPMYLFVGAQVVFLIQAQNPLWWQFFVSINMTIIAIINYSYYGPKKAEREAERKRVQEEAERKRVQEEAEKKRVQAQASKSSGSKVGKKKVFALIALAFTVWVSIVLYAGVGKIAAVIKDAESEWIPLVTVTYVIGITGYASGWTIILRLMGLTLSVKDQIKIVYSSVFFNEVTPTAGYGGEAARAYFTIKKFGLPAGTATASIVFHRAIASVKQGIFTLPMGTYLMLNYNVPPVIMAALIIALATNLGGWGVTFYLGWNLQRAERIVGKFLGLITRIKKVSPDTKDSILHTVGQYNAALKMILKRKDLLVYTMFTMCFVWAMYGTLATYSFRAMGVHVDTMEKLFMIFCLYAIIMQIPTFLPEFVRSKEAILLLFFSMTMPAFTGKASTALYLGVIGLMSLSNLLAFIIIGGITTIMLGFKRSQLQEFAEVAEAKS